MEEVAVLLTMCGGRPPPIDEAIMPAFLKFFPRLQLFYSLETWRLEPSLTMRHKAFGIAVLTPNPVVKISNMVTACSPTGTNAVV